MRAEIKFKVGEVVSERIYPAHKLVVSYFSDGIYYCKAQEHLHRKDLVYFERDLMAVAVSDKRQIGL